MTESAKAMARRSRANNEQRKTVRVDDLTATREQFVGRMVKAHGAWIGPVITRWLDSDTADRGSWGLTDSEVLRMRRCESGEAVAS